MYSNLPFARAALGGFVSLVALLVPGVTAACGGKYMLVQMDTYPVDFVLLGAACFAFGALRYGNRLRVNSTLSWVLVGVSLTAGFAFGKAFAHQPDLHHVTYFGMVGMLSLAGTFWALGVPAARRNQVLRTVCIVTMFHALWLGFDHFTERSVPAEPPVNEWIEEPDF